MKFNEVLKIFIRIKNLGLAEGSGCDLNVFVYEFGYILHSSVNTFNKCFETIRFTKMSFFRTFYSPLVFV